MLAEKIPQFKRFVILPLDHKRAKSSRLSHTGVVLCKMGDSRSSEKELMMAGRLYYAVRDPQLLADRNACRLLCAEYNATEGRPRWSTEPSYIIQSQVALLLRGHRAGHEEERRTQILARMFKSIDLDDPPLIEPPFTCDYVSVSAAVSRVEY